MMAAKKVFDPEKAKKEILKLNEDLAKYKADVINLKNNNDALVVIIDDLKEAIQWLAEKYLKQKIKTLNINGRSYKLLDDKRK